MTRIEIVSILQAYAQATIKGEARTQFNLANRIISEVKWLQTRIEELEKIEEKEIAINRETLTSVEILTQQIRDAWEIVEEQRAKLRTYLAR